MARRPRRRTKRGPGPESATSVRKIQAAELELAVLPLRKERITLQEIADRYQVHRSTVKRAADRALERIQDAAGAKAKELKVQLLAEARAICEHALADLARTTATDAKYKAVLRWRIGAERIAALEGLDKQRGSAWEPPPPPAPPEAGTTVKIAQAHILVVPARDLARRLKQLKAAPG